MKDAKVWIRLGDNGDYEPFDTPYDAGDRVGMFTSDREPRYISKGIYLEGFEGDNYISLYWGDDDAQPVTDAELNESDKLDFEQGLLEAECLLEGY